jgi:uncharacterized cupin superfamily protein
MKAAEQETCCLLQGKVKAKTQDSEVKFQEGDLVIFPKGLDCTCSVWPRGRKHYRLGD